MIIEDSASSRTATRTPRTSEGATADPHLTTFTPGFGPRPHQFMLWVIPGLIFLFAVLVGVHAFVSARRELSAQDQTSSAVLARAERDALVLDIVQVQAWFVLALALVGAALYFAVRRVLQIPYRALLEERAGVNAALAANSRELDTANRLATVGRLTTGIAHEFGTPLGVVLTRAEMIKSDGESIDDARADADAIVEQVKRMTQMCREVLDYARPRRALHERIDLWQLVHQPLSLLALDARKHNVKMSIGGNPEPLFVLGDASKLIQVLTNVVLNAIQAMPGGGTVVLDVARAHAQPPSPGSAAHAYACMRIEDTGPGINAQDLPRIFEGFFTTKLAGEGTGLGLAVSERIVREHGGWISVRTQAGRGSCFSVYLPIHVANDGVDDGSAPVRHGVQLQSPSRVVELPQR